MQGPLWSARLVREQPDLVRQLHFDYFVSGADIAITASYQASFETYARHDISVDEAVRLMSDSVALALQARDTFWAAESNRKGRVKPLVAASVGPYGAMLAAGSEYRGNYGLSQEDLMQFHRPRMKVLLAAGADLLACETIPCLDEALAIARLLPEFPGASAWISFSCRDGEHNCQGEQLADCVARLDAFVQVVAVGVNCTPPEYISALVGAMQARTRKPILVYPNSGEHFDSTHRQWQGCPSADHFARLALDWHATGARMIGGCCRTTPADIRAVRHILHDHLAAA